MLEETDLTDEDLGVADGLPPSQLRPADPQSKIHVSLLSTAHFSCNSGLSEIRSGPIFELIDLVEVSQIFPNSIFGTERL